MRTLAATTLEQLGFEVLGARDGAEGVYAFHRHEGAIRGVLLDLTMPVMDGFEVMRAIRASRPSLPIVLCSGYDRHEVIARLPPDEHYVFLPKPFTVEQLEQAVRALLG